MRRKAQAAGLSWRTVERAKSKLGIVADRQGGFGAGGDWHWRLPGDVDALDA